MIYFEKNQILQIVLTVDAIYAEKKKNYILLYKWPDKLFNKRSELIPRCRHKTEFKL